MGEIWNNPPLRPEWKLFRALSHEHDAWNRWQSDVAWLDRDRLVYGVNRSLLVICANDGRIAMEYRLDAIVRAIALDLENQRIIAATTDGIKVVEMECISKP